jgi:hypothetical protein
MACFKQETRHSCERRVGFDAEWVLTGQTFRWRRPHHRRSRRQRRRRLRLLIHFPRPSQRLSDPVRSVRRPALPLRLNHRRLHRGLLRPGLRSIRCRTGLPCRPHRSVGQIGSAPLHSSDPRPNLCRRRTRGPRLGSARPRMAARGRRTSLTPSERRQALRSCRRPDRSGSGPRSAACPGRLSRPDRGLASPDRDPAARGRSPGLATRSGPGS